MCRTGRAQRLVEKRPYRRSLTLAQPAGLRRRARARRMARRRKPMGGRSRRLSRSARCASRSRGSLDPARLLAAADLRRRSSRAPVRARGRPHADLRAPRLDLRQRRRERGPAVSRSSSRQADRATVALADERAPAMIRKNAGLLDRLRIEEAFPPSRPGGLQEGRARRSVAACRERRRETNPRITRAQALLPRRRKLAWLKRRRCGGSAIRAPRFGRERRYAEAAARFGYARGALRAATARQAQKHTEFPRCPKGKNRSLHEKRATDD
jgi:hypothetical protein